MMSVSIVPVFKQIALRGTFYQLYSLFLPSPSLAKVLLLNSSCYSEIESEVSCYNRPKYCIDSCKKTTNRNVSASLPKIAFGQSIWLVAEEVVICSLTARPELVEVSPHDPRMPVNLTRGLT